MCHLSTLLPRAALHQRGTPADKQIDACNRIIALKAFSGEKLATVYFWRALGWNKKGDYAKATGSGLPTAELTRLTQSATTPASRARISASYSVPRQNRWSLRQLDSPRNSQRRVERC